MATIDSAAHWSDGAAGCRNQRPPRIGEIQRHKAVELERSPTSSSSSSTNSSTNKSPTATTPPPLLGSTTNPSISRASPSNNNSSSSEGDNIQKDWDPNAGADDDEDVDETMAEGKKESEGFVTRSPDVRPESVSDVTDEKQQKLEKLEMKVASVLATASAADRIIENDILTTVNTKTIIIGSNSEEVRKRNSGGVANEEEEEEETNADDDNNTDEDEDDEDRNAADRFAGINRQTTVIQRPQNRFLVNTLSQDETAGTNTNTKGPITTTGAAGQTIAPLSSSPIWRGPVPKMQSADSRPNSPRASFSPGGSPLGSPRSNRRRTPLKESRRISIEQSGDAVQVNQYKLMEEIGKGAYGLVKLAYNKDDSTLYAMKMLSKSRLIKKAGLIGRGPKKAAQSMTPLQRVYKEVAVLKKLNHPNVVKLVEVLDDPAEDCLYLAFELEHQGEILRIPTERPLSEERAWSVFRDVLQGLEYLHYQRIIHSDIKPGNLLLGEDGHVKIADLGVCTEFLDDDATMDNKSPAGTPAFRAPETLLEGEHSYSGKAADIWSLAATLYALVYGNVPFVGLTVPAVYEKIKNEELKFPSFPAISEDLRDLIAKILVKDPAKRMTLPQIKDHKWITVDRKYPLPSEEENCRLVELETEDLNSVCRSVPKLFDTFVLIKAMLKNHSFQNPFSRSPSGRAPQRGGSRLERFVTAGRSKSAPGDYIIDGRHLSSESLLPVVSESVPSTNPELSDQNHEEPM